MFFDSAHLLSFRTAPALIEESGATISYVELEVRVQAFAARLNRGRGLLALKVSNSASCIIAYLGALRAGTPVLFSTQAEPPFPCLYIFDPATDQLTVDPAASLDLHADLALLLSTSGSTGSAKTIRLSYQNIDSNAQAIVEYLGLSSRDRAPTNLPLNYSYGLSILNSHLAAGGALLLTERTVVDPMFWSAFSNEGCTGLAGVPHTYDLLEKSPIRTADLTSLRYATQAGGKLAPERVARWAARAASENWKFIVMYGQTEAAPRMAYLPPELAQAHPDCIGIAIPNGRFRLLDDLGREITEPNEAGELIYEGPNVMMGYAIQASDLARGPETDSLATGDIAVRTPEGLYRIIGRRSRFIKPFGLRISLEEVEAHLAAQGLEAACSAGSEESLWVLVVDGPGVDPTAIRDDLERWLKVPGSLIRVRLVPHIPRRENGKIDTSTVGTQVAALNSEHDERHGQSGPARTAPVPADAADAILAAFVGKFGEAAYDRTASYRSLEGDSLSYIDMMLQLETHLPNLPADWVDKSIGELCTYADRLRKVQDVFVSRFGDSALDTSASFESLGGAEDTQASFRNALRGRLSTIPSNWPSMPIGSLSSVASDGSPTVEARAPGYRPDNLDTVRGLACVLIVALHVLGVRSGQGLDIPRPSISHAIMDALDVVRLPLFTALAGYIYGAMPATRDGFALYMKLKLKQLAIPVAFATVVYWCIKRFILKEPGMGLLETYIHSYEHLWYIYALILMFTIVALFDILARPNIKGWLAFLAAAMAVHWLIPEEAVDFVNLGGLFLPFFIFGVIIHRSSEWMRSPLVSVVALCLLIGSVAFIPLGRPEAIGAGQNAWIAWLGGASAVVLLLLYFPKLSGLKMLAAYSFTIYLWHPAANATVRTLLWKLGIDNNALLFTTGLLAGLGVPVLIHLIALRLPRFLSVPVIGR